MCVGGIGKPGIMAKGFICWNRVLVTQSERWVVGQSRALGRCLSSLWGSLQCGPQALGPSDYFRLVLSASATKVYPEQNTDNTKWHKMLFSLLSREFTYYLHFTSKQTEARESQGPVVGPAEGDLSRGWQGGPLLAGPRFPCQYTKGAGLAGFQGTFTG